MMAAPRLLAGLMPVPVMGMVARWTRNTAKPIGSGARICFHQQRTEIRYATHKKPIYTSSNYTHTVNFLSKHDKLN
ncbi:Os02g0666250 [Oryza sativa Japonica Group]|uniref:Os02g0666250 protein n=1 Tax=Oryza sativa subsp. japonica TaxID=39947 RepID=A0A0P0VMZ4_ORYSJ|nr:hypothetical protein EE612_012888 [Oryza sativa]BAS80187.1 Os02g0666250 [Oryza sativa Japonica Group]